METDLGLLKDDKQVNLFLEDTNQNPAICSSQQLKSIQQSTILQVVLVKGNFNCCLFINMIIHHKQVQFIDSC